MRCLQKRLFLYLQVYQEITSYCFSLLQEHLLHKLHVLCMSCYTLSPCVLLPEYVFSNWQLPINLKDKVPGYYAFMTKGKTKILDQRLLDHAEPASSRCIEQDQPITDTVQSIDSK